MVEMGRKLLAIELKATAAPGHSDTQGVRNVLTALILAEHIDGFVGDAPPGWRPPAVR